MSNLWKVLVLVFGCLLLTAAFVKAEEEDTDSSDNEADEGENEEAETEGDGPEEEEDVIVLTDDNFDDVVNDKDIILVEFYAPWCGHCKALAPQYAAAAKRLKENDPPVALAKLDATEHKSSGSRFDVSGYPTLKFFKKGEVHDYEGPRDEEGIIKYMQERADPNWKPPPEAVLTLTEDNFTAAINGEDLMLVEFYAPWCGHCKQLAPEYEKAAKELKQNDPPITLAKVDATVESSLASKYEVSGYPTLKVFRKGKAFDYGGGRDKHEIVKEMKKEAEGIVSYMTKQVGDASKDKGSLKDIQSFMKKDDISIVAFFDTQNDKLFEAYMEAANILREEYDFRHSFDAAARNHYKVNAGSVVVFNSERFYTKYEPKWHIFDKADGTAEEIKEFINDHSVPLVGHYSWTTKDKRYKEKRPLVMFFYSVDFSFEYRDATQMWRKKIADIAKDYKDMTFTIVNEEDFGDVFKGFGFDDSGEEMNVGIMGGKDMKYPMEPMEEFDSDEIRGFLKNFKNGKLKPVMKSQPIPKKQKGPVTVVVGNSFDKIVMDKEKDVLIEFYAPWCGHCKQLEPVYKNLAKKFKKNKNIVIAKMDATANDVPSTFQVEGFPTIYFATAHQKSDPIKFDGGRELDDMVKFIEQHATVPLEKSQKDEL